MKISFREKTVLAGVIIMGILLLMGCANRQEETAGEIQEIVTLSSEEETETESKTEEAVTESYGASKESEEPKEEEWTGKYTVENVSVESEVMKRFLEGEEEATITESYLEMDSPITLEHLYEGTLGEIVEEFYEEFKYDWEEKRADIEVRAKTLLFRNGEPFTHIWIGIESCYRELIMLLKEDEDGIKICFQDEYPYLSTPYHFWKTGLISAAGKESNHIYYRDYYLNEAGDIYKLYECEEYHLKVEDEATEALGLNEIIEREVCVMRYFLDGEIFHTVWFSDEVKEEDKEIIREHIIDGKYGEKMIFFAEADPERVSYTTEEEVWNKIEAYVKSLGIDPAVLYELEEIY